MKRSNWTVWFLLIAACTSPAFAEINYSKTVEVPPLRISYAELQAVLDKGASLMNAANGSLPLWREEMDLRKGELRVQMSGHQLEQDHARLPQTLDRFEYTASTRDTAPVSRLSLTFSDYSRTLSVQGQSPDQVDAVFSALRDEFSKLSTSIGGPLFGFLRFMSVFILAWGLLFPWFVVGADTSPDRLGPNLARRRASRRGNSPAHRRLAFRIRRRSGRRIVHGAVRSRDIFLGTDSWCRCHRLVADPLAPSDWRTRHKRRPLTTRYAQLYSYMKGMAVLFLILSLVWCAAEPPKLSTQEFASQTKLLEAPTQLTIAGVTISFESEAYLNLMPRSVMPPGQKIDCTKEGWLIVPVHLKVSSALPTGLVIDGVWVHSNGKWWSGTFNRDERDGLAMIARGCPTDPFKPGDTVDVVIRLQQAQKVEYLRALPKQLGAAY